MKYTEGKWYPVDYAGTIVLQASPKYGEPDLFDYNEFHNNYFSMEEAEANANLASKAPQMYEALRDCLLKLDIAHNDYNVPCRTEIKELQSLLKEIES